MVKPVVKQNVKANATAVVNTVVKKVTAPLANTIKAAANKTEKKRETFQTVLDVGKSVQSPVVNAWANYAQGEYDTLAGQINGFIEFSDNPAQTIENSVNYFLSDPLRNNPATALGMYYYEVGKASNVHDWNTVSYKLGVGAVNLSEFYAGAKIGSKMPEIKASAAKLTDNIAHSLSEANSRALSKLGSYADDFSMQSPALAGGIDGSAISVKSEFASNAGGIRAGAGKNFYYSSNGVGKSSGRGISKEYIPLAKPGEDLFVGTYSKSRYANLKTGINATHTPHHVVQDAISKTSHGRGITINLRKDLHELTGTFKKSREIDPLDLRKNLAADVWELRKILNDAGYDRIVVNRQLKELIRQNIDTGDFGK